MVLTWCSQDITLSLPSLIIHKWPSWNVKSDTSSVTSVLTASLSRLKTSHRRDIYRCGWFFCEFAKWPPCPLRRVQQIAPLPDFHGNLHFHHSVILDRRLSFTPSAICLSNMEVCLGFPFFSTHRHTHTQKKAFQVEVKEERLGRAPNRFPPLVYVNYSCSWCIMHPGWDTRKSSSTVSCFVSM